MADRVPDTHTFSEQNVVDVVTPVVESLDGSFDDSIVSYFDPAYEGAKDRLSNFRNYGPNITPVTVRSDGSYISGGSVHYYSTSLFAVNPSFIIARNQTVGQIEEYVTKMNCWVDYTELLPSAWRYRICRSYMRFNFSSIPAGATCVYARLRFAIKTYYGWQYGPLNNYGNLHIFRANCNNPIIGSNYSGVSMGQYAFSGSESHWVNPTYGTMKSFTATAADRSFLETKFGSVMHVAVMTDNDWTVTAPGYNVKLGIELARTEAWIDIDYSV
jgi:hypothetical protein